MGVGYNRIGTKSSIDTARRLPASLCRLLACRRGAGAIEFALAAPVLFFFVVGIMEVGMVLFVNTALEGGVRQASRIGMTGYVPEGMTREEAITQIILDNGMGLIDPQKIVIETTTYESFGAVGTPGETYDDENGNGEYDSGEPFDDANGNGAYDGEPGVPGLGGAGDVVLYQVSYDWPMITGLLASALGGADGKVSLSASIAVRNEPVRGVAAGMAIRFVLDPCTVGRPRLSRPVSRVVYATFRLARRFLYDRRGSALVEMAILMPIFALLLIGSVEVARYILVVQKIDKAAVTMADLVAQERELTDSQLAGLFEAVDLVATPFSITDDGAVLVSSVSRDVDDVARVAWQRQGAGTLSVTSQVGQVGDTATLPGGFTLREEESVVVAEVFYEFTSFWAPDIIAPRQIYFRALFRPRRSAEVEMN